MAMPDAGGTIGWQDGTFRPAIRHVSHSDKGRLAIAFGPFGKRLTASLLRRMP